MIPEIRSTTTSPMAMPIAARPSRANATDRGSGPGSISVHPTRSPAPPATKTAVNSSNPCGIRRPRKMSRRPAEAISPSATPTFAALTHIT
jgi:hypothetical protein